MKNLEKMIAIGMLLFAVGFNLWLYRLERAATIDPNDNAFQFALVDRTNQIFDFANKNCPKNLSFVICHLSFLADHWVPNWAEGYNLPYYYSHVPQIIIVGSWKFIRSLLAVLQGVTLRNSVSLFSYYHWVIYVLLSVFPLSVFLALRVIRLPWLAAGIGALLATHISTDGLYGLDPPSFLWRGYGLSSQLFAMVWMPLALAYSFRYFAENPKHEARNPKQILNSNVQNSKRFGFGILNFDIVSNFEFRISNFWMAVIFLTATAMGHLGLGMIAMLSLLPLAIQPKPPIKKLVLLAGTVVFFLSYWIVPIFLADNYHNISFWDPPWKFASFGAKETMVRFLNGDLFDWGRGPWMTALVIVGLIAATWPRGENPKHEARNPKQIPISKSQIQNVSNLKHLNFDIVSNFGFRISYFPFALLFLFWLLMYFGRTTWGGLIDLIPGMKEFHLSRFIVGVHAAGFFLMPIGIEILVSRITYHVSRLKPLVYVAFGLLVYWIMYPQTISYASHNDRLIKQANENRANVKTDEEALFATLRQAQDAAPGRVFAGRGGWWGKDFRVAETPYYMHLSTYGIPTVLWLPQTWSPNSDVEQYFSEDQAKDYDLFGIRYVAAPPKQETQKFWKLIDERETWKLYEIESVRYFTTGVRPAIVATDKRSYGNVVRLWIQSDAHAKGLFPQLTFAKDFPRRTGLPNFKMLDEVTYRVPDGSTHNLFAEPPVYMPPNWDKLSNYPIIQLSNESNDSDMIFKASVDVPERCQECIVVLKQSFHPNWKATIDGKATQTFTVFPFFLATLVPAGTHEVIFSYEPGGLKVFLLIVEILVAGGLLSYPIRRFISGLR